ncbi:MAG: glucose-6-phosphate isomerase [Defluviitaleaceae bacterium]|nr:glucose-6-phosphate isomerase [Defluviitaleaceae bacterium]MCL2263862.1 glucose-6-phosphate isomerase [Defluviitaleaceae bacterium]
MKMRMDYNNMLSSRVSDGITQQELDKLSASIKKANKAMVDKRAAGKMAWRDLPYNQEGAVKEINDYVNEMKDEIDAFVVLGIGGSALGPMAVQQALNHPWWNELPREKRNGFPKLYVLDNVDPERLVYFFQTVDPTRCLYNVISKSGSTSETMSQFMIIQQMLEEKVGKEAARRKIVCTTDAVSGNLITIAKAEGYKYFIIPSAVGGRFSELTPVGLLPAAFCGIDIKGLLVGAAAMDEACKEEDIYKNPAHMYALLHYIGMTKGKNISVMMPYADSLKFISDWYAQLWAESLGKQFDNDGKTVNVGQTPVKTLGVTDQHSQVQLYAEGPFDKIIVFLGVDEYRETITIPKTYADMPSLGFLGGVTHNKLIKTEQDATEYAITKSGRMNMTLTLPKVTASTLGQLLYFFEVATAYAGELLNIDAFDQPGVEEGKNATYAMFGRPGYEEKKAELDAAPAKDDKYII